MPAMQRPTSRPDLTGDATPDGRDDPASAAETDGDPVRLATQIERAQLRVRVRALERELAARERRHEEIVYRYEQVLSERTASDGADASPPERGSRLRRLLVPGQ